METPRPIPRPFRHGLIIGKLRPPHEGHLYLIRSAAAFCDHLTVGVFDHESLRLSLQQRVEILRESFPSGEFPRVRFVWAEDPHPIDYTDPKVWAKHVEIFERTVRTDVERQGQAWPTARPDVLFTSEQYGDELAARLGIATHVCLDQPRTWKQISATQVRGQWLEHWERLPQATRARLCLRIVLLGAESTGTTTLTEDLTSALRNRGGLFARTQSVPEFGREFSAAKLAVARGIARAQSPDARVPQMEDLEWTEADFVHIAQTQTRWEDAAAHETGPVLICDTDALATAVWHERYRGGPSAEVERLAAKLAPRALYILTDERDVPFIQDGLRDGEHLRPWMNDRFEEVLKNQAKTRGEPYLRVRGTRAERVALVLARVDALLGRPLEF